MSSKSLTFLKQTLRQKANPKKAKILSRFFKTAPGQYGEGDRFLGITVPILRAIAKQFVHLPLKELKTLLHSSWHEERLLALLILVAQYERISEQKLPKTIYQFYTRSFNCINNWDLVDLSAPKIVGHYLFEIETIQPLMVWAKSKHLWTRRVAIVSTHYFIRNQTFTPTFKMVRILLKDQADLIHKACGWMLREVGKRDKKALVDFLNCYASKMPRVMLRYAIEHFADKERKFYRDL